MRSAICFAVLCAGLVLWQFPCALDCLSRGIAGAYEEAAPAQPARGGELGTDAARKGALPTGAPRAEVRRERELRPTSAPPQPVVKGPPLSKQVRASQPIEPHVAPRSTSHAIAERRAERTIDAAIDATPEAERNDGRAASIAPDPSNGYDVAPR